MASSVLLPMTVYAGLLIRPRCDYGVAVLPRLFTKALIGAYAGLVITGLPAFTSALAGLMSWGDLYGVTYTICFDDSISLLVYFW